MTTALTVETPSTGVAPSRGPRGLVWAMLRVHRWALWFWALLVAVGAGALLFTYGPGTDAAWAEYRAMGCHLRDVGPDCDFSGPAISRLNLANTLGDPLLSFVPLLVAAWAGAALIGRELESGTAQLAWTQSVSPARWLAAKLAVAAVLLVSGTTVLTLLHRLAWSSTGRLRSITPWREWYEDDIFLANGTLATAYALLGLAVGVLAGLLQRRALPALGTAAVGLLVLMYTLSAWRPHLWPVETLTSKDGHPEGVGMPLGEGALTSTGARISDPVCLEDTKCLAEHDVVGYYRDHHPASHFWPLQLMETALVLAVAALAVLIAFRLLRRRTGAAV
ncbi:ABC transporter [Streptomyces bicolor]|uniref:ABC transporter n=1 Tax=Streptomyces bicolor TaxID=66874 RepID=UPI0004E1E2FA|nr:ABC transporter [Streptomyces bicolor]